METTEYNDDDTLFWRKMQKSHRRGKVAAGFMLIIAGALFMAREAGAELPSWLFTWKALLIGIGFVFGIRHGFRRPGWLVPVFIGTVFIIADVYPEFSVRQYLWPLVLIVIGIAFIFKPGPRHHHYRHWQKWQHKKKFYAGMKDAFNASSPKDDFIDSTSFMGGIKKNVITKNFRGGDITNVFGGAEINLSQADFEGTAVLDITQVFGGTRLIVPANWEIKSSLTAFFGGIEDKRPAVPRGEGPVKKLILEGTSVFGGIDIESYS
jgi:predicted membrane protein